VGGGYTLDKDFKISDIKPATPRSRERRVMNTLVRLMEIDDESTLAEALEKDFKITKSDRRYAEIMKIWRGEK
jgi:hypothetical protein